MNLVYGVDVSVWEPSINWRTLREQGVRFALVRATSGVGYVDSLFASHWDGARREGILRGAYHYLIAGQDARQQADLFIKTIGSDKGELPPIVDLEDKYNENETNKKIISTCKAVLDRIEQTFGRRPMIYSRSTYLQEHLTANGKAPGWAKNYDLWTAQYPWAFRAGDMPNKKMPTQPEGWKDWMIWQYSESAIIDGVTDKIGNPTECDLDWFRGTEAELYQFANITPKEAESYTVKAGDSFKAIADSHNVSLTELLDANPALLQAGSSLTIPARVEIPAPLDDGRREDPKPVITHKVKPEDTLGGIALKYHTTVEAILAINPQITNRNLIFDGQIIVIP